MSDLNDQIIKVGHEIRSRLLEAIDSPCNREGVSVELLKSMLANIENIIYASEIPLRPTRGKTLTRMIVDSWPMNTKLGEDIAEWEALYVDL